MKNFIIVTMLLALYLPFSGTASAQEGAQRTSRISDTVIVSKHIDTVFVTVVDTLGVVIDPKPVWRNWYVQVGGGVSMFLGENDRFGPLSGRLTPAIEVSVGHWITPNMGFRFQFNGLTSKGYADDPNNHLVYDEVPTEGGFYKQKWDYRHLHADLLFDYSSIFNGYKEDRFFSFIAYAGLGILHSPNTPFNNEITANMGFIGRFRITEALDLSVEWLGTMMHDRYDQEVDSIDNLHMEGQASLTVALAYRFNPRGWDRPTHTAEYLKETVVNEVIREETVILPPVIVKEVLFTASPIFFELNKWEITNRSRVSLGIIAKTINEASNTNKVYTIVGHADMQTGNDRINTRLSKKRAEAVYNTLINEFGVDSSRLTIDYKGGVDYMYYDDNTLSRVVILL